MLPAWHVANLAILAACHLDPGTTVPVPPSGCPVSTVPAKRETSTTARKPWPPSARRVCRADWPPEFSAITEMVGGAKSLGK